MANKKASARAKALKVKAAHSWPWVIFRIVQILLCGVITLGVTLFLRFAYHPRDINANRRRDENDDYSTPPWYSPPTSGNSISNTDDDDYLEDNKFWPFVALGVLMAAAILSLISCFITLLLYCCGKLSLKFTVVWDLFLSIVWLVGTILIGKLITDNAGWSSNHRSANLYKLDFALTIISMFLFMASASFAVHLIMVARGTSNGNYAPMTMAPPYMAQRGGDVESQSYGETPVKKPQTYGDADISTPIYSTYTGPPTGPMDDDTITPAHR